MKNKTFVIAVDFDGTIVEHHFPEIKQENPLAFHYMKLFQEAGARLILYTMRDDNPGVESVLEYGPRKYLEAAVKYCKDRGIEFWGVNVNPQQVDWSSSPKVYGNVYIDDAAFGCPLRDGIRGERKMVDWSIVGPGILEMIKENNE